MNTADPIAPTPQADASLTEDIAVGGMTCASCVGRVERALRTGKFFSAWIE